MDIICSQCRTEYEFDEKDLLPHGVRVQCTTCGHTFQVSQSTDDDLSSANDNDEITAKVNLGHWMVRQGSGEVYQFEQLTTLQQWIVERRVTREDEISRGGTAWKRLGSIPELETFFRVVDAANSDDMSQGGNGRSNRSVEILESAVTARVPARERGGEHEAEPAFTAEGTEFSSVGERAAWEVEGSGAGPVEEDEFPLQRSRTSGLVVIFLVMVLVGAGFLALQPDVARDLWQTVANFTSRTFAAGEGETTSVRDEAFTRGLTLLRKDDAESLKAAQEQFARSGVPNALSRAARAELYAVWAQQQTHEVELIMRQVEKQRSEAPHGAGGASRIEALEAEAKQLSMGSLRKAQHRRASCRSRAKGRTRFSRSLVGNGEYSANAGKPRCGSRRPARKGQAGERGYARAPLCGSGPLGG